MDYVIKPYPTIDAFFGGGEEGSWIRKNPGKELPWYLSGNYITIFRSDWEWGEPFWLYMYLGVWSLWIVFLLFYIVYYFSFLFRNIAGKLK